MSVDSRYIRIATKFWQDEKARRLSDDAKLLYLYVLTSPHSNMAGYYVLPKPYVAYDLKWLPERLDKAFAELLRTGLIKCCEQNDVVFIPNFFKYNPIQNRNQAVGVAKRVSELPANALQKDFLAAVKRFAQPFMELFAERLTEWFGNTETDTETETDTDTDTEDKHICASKAAREHLADQDSDENVEADKVTVASDEQPGEKSGPRSPFKSKRQEQLFDEFWEAYPKKRSKGRAERAWVKIKPDEQLFKAIMDGLKRAKTSVEWLKDDEQYIPYPSTWLNSKGWEDEYKTTAEVNNDAKHQRYTSGPSAFGNTKPQNNRFAGLVRDGGTGRIAGGQDGPLGGGNGPSARDTGEGASSNENHNIAAGVSMA